MERRSFLCAVAAIPAVAIVPVAFAQQAAPGFRLGGRVIIVTDFGRSGTIVKHGPPKYYHSKDAAYWVRRDFNGAVELYPASLLMNVANREEFYKMMAENGWIKRQCNASYVHSRSAEFVCSTPCALQYSHEGPHKDFAGEWSNGV